uniref:Cytochrome c oxidase subunit 2 n=1 Tax=Rhyacophila kando TaxID=2904902 RepID=A0A9E8RT67_9NEOP|nr:cytochrome c oxidase subunit II [Rhyacophila kando]UZZ44353.1 cytochrome c oxidase subunit II [Rhyacophila kando]
MATWSNLELQNSSSPLMEQLILFYDHTLMFTIMITIFISYLMINLMFNKFMNRFLLEEQNIEIIWTLTPTLILIFIAFPSLRLLYLIDEINNPTMSLKTIGHQWYWSYEYSDFHNVKFDSYMIPQNENKINEFRLLHTDNRTILPMYTQIRLITTALDVIHSWTVPTLGIKIDSTPGRLNQGNFFIMRPGIFFGQCSEICGTNHSFMPIMIESIMPSSFISWIKNYN